MDSLSETTRFANSNLLNITTALRVKTYSRERFSLVIYHTCTFIIKCTHRQLNPTVPVKNYRSVGAREVPP
jgi:hypothetical protein